MADNYTLFSEVIEELTPEACEWVRIVLNIDPTSVYYQFARVKEILHITDRPALDLVNWPNFKWKIDEDSLWLYSEEGYDGDHLIVFVQALLRNFMPDFIFTMTTAEICSKPRASQFGGEWLAISKDEVQGGNTWDEAKKVAVAMRGGV